MSAAAGPDPEDPYREDPEALLDEADYHVTHAIEELREIARRKAAMAAEELVAVRRVTGLLGAAAAAELAGGPRVPGQPAEETVVESAVVSGLAAALGISEWQAGRLWAVAERLHAALPETLAALAAGRLDAARAFAVAEATADCALDETRDVERALLERAGAAPWEGPSPRAWRERISRTVASIAPDSARERRERVLADRSVRTWVGPDGDGVLRLTATPEQVATCEGVIADLAARWPAVDDHGRPVSLDQRRADATLDLFRRVRDGERLPDRRTDHVGVRRTDVDRVTLVLHADTFLREGPATFAAGQLRGLGQPTHLDPLTSHRLARDAVAAGARVQVLLTDPTGQLRQVVNLRRRPAEGWTRGQLTEAVRVALAAEPPQRQTDSYRPTAAIEHHVRARNPTCTSYDCPRVAGRCDLDHDQPWPRGPTSVENLQPRCPRHHEQKTRRLVRTTLHPDGSVGHRVLGVLSITTTPEPLPGHGPYEGHDADDFRLPDRPTR